ncbi:MAG: EAL domain-containing protein [Lachnospiraceae bacterium]|nr:EAL domain-containing protein [Lachnospiraceae bacterium]
MLSIQKTESQKAKDLRESPQARMGVLQEELELERVKKEIISSLYNDWIYEYNVREKKVTTISGNSMGYCAPKDSGFGQHYLMLDDLHPEDKAAFVDCCRGTYGERDYGYTEARIMVDGEYRWISLTTRVIKNYAGEVVSVIGKISDINTRKKEELRLKAQAMQDAMTGLLNRSAFLEQSEKVLEVTSQTQDRTPALLIVDVDKFKRINDNYGHLYGDTVIVSMADALRTVFGEEAVIGRFGGDEFTVLLLHAEEKQLENKIVELREVYSRDVAETNDGQKVTCSVGAARYGVDGTTIDELLTSADSALYYIKENGRNGYAICTDVIKKKFSEGSDQVLSEEPTDANRRISAEITEFALELLEGSKDLKSAMNMLLMRIGKRFRLGAVSVREYNKKNVPEISYLWSNMEAPEEQPMNSISPEEHKRIREIFRKNQIMEISDVESLSRQSGLYQLYSGVNIRAIYQCPFVSEGQVFGYIAYVDIRPREWTDLEKQSLSLISRIISNYLARELAYEKITRKIELLKSRDEVTGLLKYEKFKEVAQRLLDQSTPGVQYAVVSTDFTHFKYFNEVYGFRNGDEILKDFASLVAKHNPRSVAACRDYADNFLVMVTVKDAESLVTNIENYHNSFTISQNERYMDSKLELCSGAYVITNPEAGIVQALDNANTARKILKEKGRSGVLLFEPSMRANRMKEIALIHMLDEALENSEFCLYLQPKFSLETGKLIGAEGLSRWVKPTGETILPGEFIPSLEKSGKIVQLDFYMYEAVLRQQKKWLAAGYPVVPVSVNLSRHHIKDEQLVEKLVNLLETYGVDSSLIEIEITESAFIEDQNSLIELMKEIKRRGFGVSIDDFGTGYSSLSMLTELPADIVKLDKDFLKNSESESTKGMLNNVIRLIKDNHMNVVCEGVEIGEQADFLAKAGCDIGQGFYFSKPVPVEEFERLYFK